MSTILAIYDETVSGDRTAAGSLDFLKERITVRELIRERVYQEVREYNAKSQEYFRGLVRPTDAEQTLNGYKLRQHRRVDWEKQYALAITAFESNGFFILVDDRQVDSLDDEIELRLETSVSFVKLVPLVGG